MQWTFVAVGPVQADVEMPAGAIDVRAMTGDLLEVTLEPAGLGARRAEELIAASEVSFDSDRLSVHVPSKAFRNTGLICTVTLPDHSSLRVKTASADVSCPTRLSEFAGDTASGDVRLGEVTGDARMSLASGDFRSEVIGGRLQVKGASGDVSAGVVTGEVEIALASGDVVIDDALSSVKVSTASGDVRIGQVHAGKITLNSASGDVSLGVAKGAGARLDVTSISGDVSCDLPFGDETPSDAALNITCVTVSGDVRIRPAE